MNESDCHRVRMFGIHSYKREHWVAAIVALEAYTSRVADDSYAWFALGDSFRMIGLSSRAETCFEAARRTTDKRVATASILGHWAIECFERGDCARAASLFKKSFDADAELLSEDKRAGLFTFCGRNAVKLMQLEEALDWLTKACELGDIESNYWLAVVHRALKNYEQAAHFFTQSRVLPNTTLSADALRDDCRNAAILRRSTSSNEFDTVKAFNEQWDRGNIASASELFCSLSAGVASESWFQETQLRILTELHRFEDALRLAVNMSLPEDSYEEHWHRGGLGQMHAAMGNYDLAIAEFAAAISCASPENPTYWLWRGASLMHLERFVEAKKDFQRAVEIGDIGGEMHLNLGYSLRVLGQYDEAAVEFSTALAADPGYAEAKDAKRSLRECSDAKALVEQCLS